MEQGFCGDYVLFEHKTAGIKQQCRIDIAQNHVIYRRTGINALQPRCQFRAFTGYIRFGQQDAVGITNLRLCQRELIQLRHGMHGIHQRNNAV